MNEHHRHKHVTQEEFSRQADQIVFAPSFIDEDTTEGIVRAVGPTYQDRILDVACGTGVVAFCLAKTAKEVVGLDITGEMLQKARKQRHDQGLTNVHFELGEAEALPFEDAAFDATVCRMSVHHFSNPSKALSEMKRVTKPGGCVVIADIVSVLNEKQAALHNAIERLRDPSHIKMLSPNKLIELVAANGLRIEKSETWSKVRYFDEWAKVLNAPKRIDPLHIILLELAEAGLQAGMKLEIDEHGKLRFEHQWLMIKATNP
jgi:ubiquinone/menaquinone biosynthesis C-methylase UbiE